MSTLLLIILILLLIGALPTWLGVGLIGAATAALFAFHVLRIFLRCSKEKMSGIATRRVVAVMANVHSFGDWSESNLPSNAMSGPVSSPVLNVPVAFAISCADPHPAFVWLPHEHIVPKLFSKWLFFPNPQRIAASG